MYGQAARTREAVNTNADWTQDQLQRQQLGI
jgi:hypothetical protein